MSIFLSDLRNSRIPISSLVAKSISSINDATKHSSPGVNTAIVIVLSLLLSQLLSQLFSQLFCSLHHTTSYYYVIDKIPQFRQCDLK